MVFTVALLLVVVTSILGVFQVIQKQAAYVQDRSESLETMRIAMDRMTKEIRQARLVTPDGVNPATRFTMSTYVLGNPTDITYAVDAQNRLTRTAAGSTTILQERVANTAVFGYTSDTAGVVQVVTLNLEVTPRQSPDTTLVLTSEVRLRNRIVL